MAHSAVLALVLAAGRSRRFGGDKLTARLRGKPVLELVLDTLEEARQGGLIRGTLVVIPPDHPERLAVARARGVPCQINPQPESGVAESLRIGIHGIATREPQCEAILIVPGDQPLLRPEVIALVITTWKEKRTPVVRPRYADDPETPGHPVLLSRPFWPRVDELRGDRGLISLLKADPEVVTVVEVDGNNPEINTPADLAAMESESP